MIGLGTVAAGPAPVGRTVLSARCRFAAINKVVHRTLADGEMLLPTRYASAEVSKPPAERM